MIINGKDVKYLVMPEGLSKYLRSSTLADEQVQEPTPVEKAENKYIHQKLCNAERQWRHILSIARASTEPCGIVGLKEKGFISMGLEPDQRPDYDCYLCVPKLEDIPTYVMYRKYRNRQHKIDTINKWPVPPDCSHCPLRGKWSATTTGDVVVNRCNAPNGLYKRLCELEDATSVAGLFLIEEIHMRILNRMLEVGKRRENKGHGIAQ